MNHRPHRLSLALGLAAILAAGPAHALRVMTWNIHDYDTSTNTITARQPSFRTAIAAADPDVIVVQELLTSAAEDSFYYDVLGVVEPGQWAKGSYQTGTKSPQSAVFWKTARVNVTTIGQFDDGGPRNVMFGIVKPLGYVSNAGWFRVYSMHLKAGGPATSDSTTRRLECTSIRTTLNATTSQGPNFMLGGDTNFYSAFEGGYIRLTESQGGANDYGRCWDWLGAVMGNADWHTNGTFAAYDTQSPCNSCNDPSFSGGGLDDRFDIWFTSYSLHDSQGVEITDYTTFGQDGLHFNTDVNAPPTNAAVGQAVADALWLAADHLPVIATVQLAARVVASSQLDFGSVLVGATAQRTLDVSDGGTPPVDALDYSFATVPAGFTAPAGSFKVASGSTNHHAIGMSTAGAGTMTGTLVMSTDDPDSLSKSVKLSGTVLDHAQPSLDAASVVTAGTLDWGSRPQGSFGDSTVTVYDLGYGPLRARLDVTGAGITGGSGRFSLVGGSFPTLAAGTGVPFTVHFDDTDAAVDTTYEATLTFATADEPLPGAATLTPLTVTLRAHRTTGATGVDDTPRALAFIAPRPNPLSGGCALGFDLPRAAAVELAIYDLTGRRMATLASGAQPAGRHLLRWDATDDSGARAGAGIYFVRFRTAGMERTARVAVLP